MNKRRIITIVNIILSVIIMIAVFLPITNKSLFDHPDNIAKYIILVLGVMSIVLNSINKKVEMTYITCGYVFFYALDFGWGYFKMLNYGFFLMLLPSFVMLILTAIYGLIDEKEKPKPVKSAVTKPIQNQNVGANYGNRNPYQNMPPNMNNQYPMYPNNQGYGNYKR